MNSTKLVAATSRAVLSKKSAPLVSMSFKFTAPQNQTRFIQTLRKKNNPGFFDVISGIVSIQLVIKVFKPSSTI